MTAVMWLAVGFVLGWVTCLAEGVYGSKFGLPRPPAAVVVFEDGPVGGVS